MSMRDLRSPDLAVNPGKKRTCSLTHYRGTFGPHARSPAFEERVRSTIRHESAVSQDADVSHLIVHMTETTAGYNVWSGYYPLTNALIVDLSRQIVADLLSKMRETMATV